MSEPTQLVGIRVKEIRKVQGLTLRDLAASSGVSVNTISLIERGKTSPTINTLYKVATAMGVNVTDFCALGEVSRVVHHKQDTRNQTRLENIVVGDLGSNLPGQYMEPMLITYDPMADSGHEPLIHNGHELVFCLQGEVEYTIDNRQFLLESGDSLLFEASLPHSWKNMLDDYSQALVVSQRMQKEYGRLY